MRRRHLIALLVGLTALVGGANAFPGDSAVGASVGGTCAHPILVDYTQPLKEMKPIRAIPRSGVAGSGVIGSAEERLYIGQGLDGPVLVGPNPRFSIGVSPVSGRTGLIARSSWAIEVDLLKVRRSGEPIWGSSRERRYRWPAGEESLSIEFPMSGSPAFYRADLTLTTREGTRLKPYSIYLRVVRARTEVCWVTEDKTVQPGGVLATTLENRGTTSVSFGYPAKLDRLEGQQWISAGTIPGRNVAFIIPGGGTMKSRAGLPEDLPPGYYRLRQIPPLFSAHNREVTVEFEVVP